MSTLMIIDPPSAFDDEATWRAFLASLQRLLPRTAQVEASIAAANEMLSAFATGGPDAAVQACREPVVPLG